MKEQNETQAIEEMAYSVCRLENKPENCASCMWKASCENYLSAENYYAAGYCKQIVGEWKPQMQELNYFDTCECSICGYVVDISKTTDYNFCPNCGAKMKGGA